MGGGGGGGGGGWIADKGMSLRSCYEDLQRYSVTSLEKRVCMTIGSIPIALSLLDCLRTGCRMPQGFCKEGALGLGTEWNFLAYRSEWASPIGVVSKKMESYNCV